jgi:hypothetical protein
VADVKGVHVAGFAAWALWLLVHLFYLIGFQNRLLVLLRWTISFVTRGRGARLIVDRDGTDRAETRLPPDAAQDARLRAAVTKQGAAFASLQVGVDREPREAA